MTIVPETRSGKIDFYRSHVPVWAQDPASIGLTDEAVETLQQLTDEARAAFMEHQRAEQIARAATLKYHESVRRMHAGGGGVMGGQTLLQLIKSFAQLNGEGVYARAQIPSPAKPGRPGSIAEPGTPYLFKSSLRQTGELELTWKCDHPDGAVGTTYQIKRQLDDGPLAMLATVGEKRFLDENIPPGTKRCTYEVTAMRSTGKGKAAEYPLSFGNAHPIKSFEIKPRRLVA